MQELRPLGNIMVASPQHPHHNPDEVRAIEVTSESLHNETISGVTFDYGFPYFDVNIKQRGIDEFGRPISSTIIDHHFLTPGDFIVTELSERPDDQPKTFVLDAETFSLNYEPIANKPGHYRAITDETIVRGHSEHLLGDEPFCGFAFAN